MKLLIVLLSLTVSSIAMAQSAKCVNAFNSGAAHFDKGVIGHNNGVASYNSIGNAPSTEAACEIMKGTIVLFNSAFTSFTGSQAGFTEAVKVCDPNNAAVAKENLRIATSNSQLSNAYITAIQDLQTQYCIVE